MLRKEGEIPGQTISVGEITARVNPDFNGAQRREDTELVKRIGERRHKMGYALGPKIYARRAREAARGGKA